MNIWSILGIAETKDKDTLKKAYRQKLVSVNPEDDPQGFMELRQAYEEAVAFADSDDSENNNENHNENNAEEYDDGSLEYRLKRLYFNFWNRIDLSEWEMLFQEDWFFALDKEQESEDILIRFLMENFHLPNYIWKFLCEALEIKERKNELCEKYPEEFLDYMMNNAKYDDLINYKMFSGNESLFDDFLDAFYRANSALRNHNIAEQQHYLDRMEELDVKHPFLEMVKIRMGLQDISEKYRDYVAELSELEETKIPEAINELYSSELSKFMESAKALLEEYPDCIEFINLCGDVALVQTDFDQAGAYYEDALKIDPDNYMTHGKHAEYLYCVERFEEARNEYMDLLKKNHFDNAVRNGMIKSNYGFIEQLKKRIEENPDDKKSKMEMVWSYYQSYQFKEALNTLNSFEPTEEQECEYANVKGRTYLCLMDYDNAREWFFVWKEAIERIPEEDHSEEAEKRKKRYEYVNFLIADCYIKQKQYDTAREYLTVALKKDHEEIELSYEAKCELEYECGNYDACLEACENLIRYDNRSYIGYNFRSKAFHELGYKREALNSAEISISIYPYVAEPYCLITNVFLSVGNIDAAKQTIERYRTFEIDSDNIEYHMAKIFVQEKKYQEAINTLLTIIDNNNDNQTEENQEASHNSDLEDLSRVHYLLGICYTNVKDDNLAKEQFDIVANMNEEHPDVYRQLGLLYRRHGKYIEAIQMFDKQIKIAPSQFDVVNRATLQNLLSNYKSALEDFKLALEMDPRDAFCHFRIAIIYEMHKNFDKALKHYDLAKEYYNNETEDGLARIKVILMNKARTFQCMKKFSESEACYLEFFEKYGKTPSEVYDYSELLIRLNRMEDAVNCLRECIENPEYQEKYEADVRMCMRQLCSIYGQEGYIDKANEIFSLAIEKNPEDYKAYACMAGILREHQIFDEAAKLYEKAIELDKDNKENYYSSLVECIIGKRTIFKPDVKELQVKAMIPEKDLKNPLAFIRMARLYRTTKKYKEAIVMADRAIKQRRCYGCFYSSCHEAWYERGLIFEALKEYDTARKCYQCAIDICGHNTVYEERLKRIESK